MERTSTTPSTSNKPWKDSRFLIPFIGSLVLTPFAIGGAISGGHHRAPDESYIAFPYAMLLYGHLPSQFSSAAFVVALLLLLAQIPFYGAAFGYSIMKSKWRIVVLLLTAHVVAAFAALMLR